METETDVPTSLAGPARPLTLDEVRDRPLNFLEELHARYGDAFRYAVRQPGQGIGADEPVTVLTHPDAVGEVLRGQAHRFTKERTPDHFMLSPLLGNGLLTSNGDDWHRQRTALAPLFRPSEVLRFDTLIVRAAHRLVDDWQSAGPLPVDVEPVLSALTLEILVQAVFGRDLTGVGSGFGTAVTAINHFIGRFRADDLEHDPVARQAMAGYLRGSAVVNGITDALLASLNHTSSAEPVMHRMAAAVGDPRELHDQVLTLIMAGHETTAKTLVWALHLLAVHPGIQDRAAEEARAAVDAAAAAGRELGAADLPHLPLTAGSVREAMRLYPPVWLISRRTREPVTITGLRLPADALVCLSPWLLHRDQRWWPEPARFDPRRHATAPAPFTYAPFGGGERVCIGRHLATLEATLVLAVLLARGTVRPGDPDDAGAEPEALVTLRPRGGMRLALEERAATTGAGRA